MNTENNKKLKILIVEDDHYSLLLLKVMVKNFSREVIVALNGLEAVLICQNNPDIDLVLMDIRLPIMNGYDATKKIREFNKEVVIIAQTAYALYGEKEKALTVGCTDYISKPLSRNFMGDLMIKYFSEKIVP